MHLMALKIIMVRARRAPSAEQSSMASEGVSWRWEWKRRREGKDCSCVHNGCLSGTVEGKGGENGKGKKREREREGGGERVNDKVEEEDYTKWSITVFLC